MSFHKNRRAVESFVYESDTNISYGADSLPYYTSPSFISNSVALVLEEETPSYHIGNIAVGTAKITATSPAKFKIVRKLAATEINRSPLHNRDYIESGTIDYKAIKRVTFAEAQSMTYAVTSVFDGASVVPVEDTRYALSIASKGAIAARTYGVESAQSIDVEFTTTSDFTGIADTTDYLVQNLAAKINKKSILFGGNENLVAFAIDPTATSGVVISTLADNTVVPTYISGGITQNFKSSDASKFEFSLAASIRAALAASGLAAGSTIIPAGVSTAGTGAASEIFIVALDITPAFDDRTTIIKTDFDVKLTAGFLPTVSPKKYSFAYEGRGYGFQLEALYRNTQAQRLYNVNHLEVPVINYPNLLPSDTAQYTVATIEHTSTDQVGPGGVVISPKIEYLISPDGEATFIDLLGAVTDLTYVYL